MKFIELKDLSEKELIEKLVSFKKEAMYLRFKRLGLGNGTKIKYIKKDIARVYTMLNSMGKKW